MSWKTSGTHSGGPVYSSQGSGHNCCQGFCSRRTWSSISIFILSGVKENKLLIVSAPSRIARADVLCIPTVLKGVAKYTTKLQQHYLAMNILCDIILLAIYQLRRMKPFKEMLYVENYDTPFMATTFIIYLSYDFSFEVICSEF